MPKDLERRLRQEANKKHLRGMKEKAYVYSVLNRIKKPKDSKKRKH